MKAIPNDKFAATVVCALAIASFGVTPQVHANPVFPPQHVAADAHFAPAATETAELASPSWYRGGDITRSLGDVRITDEPTVASVAVASWYRTAN